MTNPGKENMWQLISIWILYIEGISNVEINGNVLDLLYYLLLLSASQLIGNNSLKWIKYLDARRSVCEELDLNINQSLYVNLQKIIR